MDPAVTAALIAAPVAVIAASAAFAAGIVQGRGAQRGPVDAVRQEHQRDAYASFLAALHAYERGIDPSRCTKRAEAELRRTATSWTSTDLHARTLELAAEIPIEEILSAQAMVELQGPDIHVVDASVIAVGLVSEAHFAAAVAYGGPDAAISDFLSSYDKLYPARRQFTLAARAALYGGEYTPDPSVTW